jgi:hypothetical protein
VYAAFLQNAPVVRHTRGFTPGWYAVPRWGTPNASPSPSLPAGPNHPAAAGPGRSEHRNVDILIPVARQRESPTGPNVPCERRTDPAEPPPPSSPRRQPRHSATAEQVRAPGCMRRSFRTHRLCAIPGVSPRAGMRCPVGALRTPQLPRAFLQDRTTQQQRDRAGVSIGTSTS